MAITEFCVRNVVCASRDMPVVDAAALMRHRHVGDVIVIGQVGDKRVPVGIVTDRDIVGNWSRRGQIQSRSSWVIWLSGH
jgi:CBS domain-containing protein